MLEGSCLCGSVHWRFDGVPESATICNCTACRRYGTLWAYDYVDGLIHVTGETRGYSRPVNPSLEFHFCPACGCVVFWRGIQPEADGRVRIAVNLRLAAEPKAVGQIALDIFDGLDTFEDLPRDGRCISNVWA
jgi:hypothetical protein